MPVSRCAVVASAAGWLLAGRASAECDDFSGGNWYNYEMSSIGVWSQKGCSISVTTTDGDDQTVAQASSGQVDGLYGSVGSVTARDSTGKPKAVQWLPGGSMFGTSWRDCPGPGWTFTVRGPAAQGPWWNGTAGLITLTMGADCVLLGSGHPLPPLTFEAIANEPYNARLVGENIPSSTIEMKSAHFVVWKNGTAEFLPPLMPLCFDPHEAEEPFEGCMWEDAGPEGPACVDGGCAWDAVAHHCDCPDSSACLALQGTWQEDICAVRATQVQIEYRVDPLQVVSGAREDHEGRKTGLSAHCGEHGDLPGLMWWLAQRCCRDLVSACEVLPPAGLSGQCLTVDGKNRMKLAARGYKLSKCRSAQPPQR